MTELLTAARMRAIEAAAISEGRATGAGLMERAGAGVVAAMLAQWPELARAPQRALVLCGPGNNGGDGFVVARLLADRGWAVDVRLYGDPGALPPDARRNHDRWAAVGPVQALGRPDARADLLPPAPGAAPPDVVVDALFGTGLTRPVTGLAPLLARLGGPGGPVPRRVAVDLPSGLCADSGRPLGAAAAGALAADLTVTFHGAKVGHVLGRAPDWCGRLVVADLGLDPGTPAPDAILEAAPFLPALRRGGGLHKYDHGHALVLSGPSPRGGAARLAARGALRAGAGLVTVAAPRSALPEHAAQLTAIMLRESDGPEALAAMLADARLTALCLGPGLGTGDDAAALVGTALASARPTLLDADALTVLGRRPDLFARLHPGCLLTPHGGEFARLFPDLAERLAAPPRSGPAHSKVDATRAAAARAGCTVLHKGPDTVIADADGAVRVSAAAYDRAAPWLATAGSGDVLAGIATGLLARGAPPLEAAATAAWLHVEAARSFGPGLIAEDLPEALPAVFRTLGL